MPASPPSRPQCSVFMGMSLDGFIARTDGGLDWLSRVDLPGEDYGFLEFFASIDALVVGRNTYEVALGFGSWPWEGKRCVVLTHRPAEPRYGESFFAGDPAALLAQLAADGVRRVYLDGGKVVQQFIAAGLVDDLTLSILPVVLGSGIRLFGDAGPERWLTLESTRSWPGGLVQLRYRAAAGEGPQTPN